MYINYPYTLSNVGTINSLNSFSPAYNVPSTFGQAHVPAIYGTPYVNPYAAAYSTASLLPTTLNPYSLINQFGAIPTLNAIHPFYSQGVLPAAIDPYYTNLSRGIPSVLPYGAAVNAAIPSMLPTTATLNTVAGALPFSGNWNTAVAHPTFAGVSPVASTIAHELPLPYVRYNQLAQPLNIPGVNPYVQSPVSTVNGIH